MSLDDFFAMLYEAGGAITIGQNGQFSFDLYLNGLYSLFGMLAWLSSLVFLSVFYFAINHPRFNRWYHWLLVNGIVSFGNGLASYFIAKNTFDAQGISYGPEYLFFFIINFIFVFLSFSFFTFLFRVTRFADLSRNCSTCPFPN